MQALLQKHVSDGNYRVHGRWSSQISPSVLGLKFSFDMMVETPRLQASEKEVIFFNLIEVTLHFQRYHNNSKFLTIRIKVHLTSYLTISLDKMSKVLNPIYSVFMLGRVVTK